MKWPFRKKDIETPLRIGGDDVEGAFNPLSSTWLFIEKWAESELAAAREKNDHARHDAVKTALIRGEISRLKKLLDLPKTEPRKRFKRQRSPILAGRENGNGRNIN